MFSLHSEFDAFLFAPIEEDSDGMLLSVVSLLARLNVDPWEEAAELARLPPAAAAHRLAGAIAALPDGSSVRANPSATAVRLIALLPHHAISGLQTHASPVGSEATGPSRAVIQAFLSVLFFIAFVVTSQCTMTGRPASGQFDIVHASDSTAAPPPSAQP